MKRYVVFGGNTFFARGGACDFIADFSRRQDAADYARRWVLDYTYRSRWAHVWDTKEMKILDAEHDREGSDGD